MFKNMELVYIWFPEEHYVLCNQNLNFGSHFCLEYAPKSQTLMINNNPNYFPGFFNLGRNNGEETDVKNITAIVGENGVGKSSILNFIKKNIALRTPFMKDIFAIIVFQDNLGSLHIYCHNEMEINIQNYTNAKYILKEIKEIGEISKLDFIFYSSIFDNGFEEIHYEDKLMNISTNYLVKEDFRKSYFTMKSELEFHRLKEIQRQVQFVTSEDKKLCKVKFPLPDDITIKISEVDMQPMLREMQKFEFTKFFKELFEELNNVVYEGNEDFFYEKYFMRNLILRVMQQLFLELPRLNLVYFMEKSYKKFREINKKYTLSDKCLMWLKYMLYSIRNESYSREQVAFFEGLIGILIYFDNNIWNGNFKVDRGSIVMSLKKDLGLFQELYKIYSQSIGRDSYLAFEWRNLSSGETAMLNLYSRFYSLIKQSTFNPNVIILIDEGELYFHPQWQKRFLSSIISFLREIFYGHGVESLQIIMTSNSPFIVSDLPSSNVIFLKRINEDSVVIKNLEGQYKTFAANIHSLFSHSFFLEDGLIGEFAKNKINYVIDLLINGNDKQLRKSRIEIEYVINNIGEPILRNKIANMLKDRFSLNAVSIEERIVLLEGELKKLKSVVSKK